MEDGLAAALRVGVPVEQAEVVSYAEVGHVEEVGGHAEGEPDVEHAVVRSDALVLLAALLTVVFRPAARISVIVVYSLYSPVVACLDS